jgi:septal ring factor EnvC (AmiA/AmiB activator)
MVMIEIWLSVLTIIILLLLLSFLKRKSEQAMQGTTEENLHELIAEFEQENKELVRSIAQIKRMVDIELAGVKEEVTTLREKLSVIQKQNNELAQTIAELRQSTNTASQSNSINTSALPSFLKDDYRDIPELFAQGMSSHEIARKLGIGDGEVEMVIQMLKKQGFLSA